MLYSSFLGGRRVAGASSVSMTNQDVSDVVIDPEDALASIKFLSGGSVDYTPSPANTTWLVSGSASEFDIRATITAGSVSTGTTGSWLNLATSRTWTVSQTFIGSKECTLTFEISRTGEATAIASCVVTLTAQVDDLS